MPTYSSNICCPKSRNYAMNGELILYALKMRLRLERAPRPAVSAGSSGARLKAAKCDIPEVQINEYKSTTKKTAKHMAMPDAYNVRAARV